MAFKDTDCEGFYTNDEISAHTIEELRYHNSLCADMLREQNFCFELRDLDGKPLPVSWPITEDDRREVEMFMAKHGALPYCLSIGRLHFSQFYKLYFPACAKQKRVFITFYVSIEDDVDE